MSGTDATGFVYGSSQHNSRSVNLKFLSGKNNWGSSYGLFQYANYGNMLSLMGFDKTTDDNAGATRVVAGGLMSGLYGLTSTVDALFTYVLKAINWLNPFNLLVGKNDSLLTKSIDKALHDTSSVTIGEGTKYSFGNAAPDTTILTEESGSDKTLTRSEGSPLYGLAQIASGLLNDLYNMSWSLMVPIFCAVFIISALMYSFVKGWKPGSGSEMAAKAKQLGVRLAFIGFGLPILAFTYTAALNSFTDGMSDEKHLTNADAVILQEFVDFGAWVSDSRLMPPDSRKWGIFVNEGDDMGNVAVLTDETTLKLRSSALKVNDDALWLGLSDTSADHGLYDFLMAGDEDIGDGAVWDGYASGSQDEEVQAAVTTMLQRYMHSDTVTAADFSGRAMFELEVDEEHDEKSDGGSGSLDEDAPAIKWFKAASEQSQYDDSNWFAVSGETPGDSGVEWFVDGDLQSSGPNDGVITYKAGDLASYGLSTAAMYNYLNTKFSGSGVEVFSPENSPNSASIPKHYAVNAIGTGAYGILLYLNSLVILLSFVLVGWGYGIGMLISIIKRSIGLIAAIPFSVLGALGSITRVIAYTIAMVIEIVVTFFLYQVVTYMLFAFDRLITTIIPNFIMGGYLDEFLNPATGKLTESNPMSSALLGLPSASGVVSNFVGTGACVVAFIGIAMFVYFAVARFGKVFGNSSKWGVVPACRAFERACDRMAGSRSKGAAKGVMAMEGGNDVV